MFFYLQVNVLTSMVQFSAYNESFGRRVFPGNRFQSVADTGSQTRNNSQKMHKTGLIKTNKLAPVKKENTQRLAQNLCLNQQAL